jgi:hypothetical protein
MRSKLRRANEMTAGECMNEMLLWLFVINLGIAYFIPAMIRLTDAADSPESVAAATRWWTLNYLRHATVLAAWLASLRALELV